ncbi:WecB/TagA/CpsF family glycosyltransferase [Epibacterium ulvae]|uniref:WecB/TagA/CpsF family glycosyltransferase n=1 Tax=Epibacterium ulvae TaxID=1156985 RepID=UPI003EBCBBB5
MKFRFGEQFIRVNVPTQDGLRQEVTRRLVARTGFALATINMDHLVKLSRCVKYLKSYQAHDIVVADGRPIVWLSQLAGRPVSLIPGSDMVDPLCHWAAEAKAPVALVGSTREALDDAAENLQNKIPGLDVAWTYAPGILDPEGEEAEWILETLQEKSIGLCFLALGAPKQERIAQRGRELAPNVGFASVGAGLDFLGGHQRRAPKWVRDLALEWLWRALSDPLRLGPRYMKCFSILPRQVLDALRLRLQPAHLYSKMPRR